MDRNVSEPLFGRATAAKCILDEYDTDSTASAMSSAGAVTSSEISANSRISKTEELIRNAIQELDDNLACIDVTVSDVSSLEVLEFDDFFY